LAQGTSRNGRPVSEDPEIRQRIAQVYIESEILRLGAYRGLTNIMKKGVPGPEGSLGKWQWSDTNQALTQLAMDIEGPYSQLLGGSDFAFDGGDWQLYLLRCLESSIECGSAECM